MRFLAPVLLATSVASCTLQQKPPFHAASEFPPECAVDEDAQARLAERLGSVSFTVPAECALFAYTDRFGQDLRIVCLETPQVDLASEPSLTSEEVRILQNAPYDRPPDIDLVVHGPTDPNDVNENARYGILYEDLSRNPSSLLPDESDALSEERQKQRQGSYSYFIEDRFHGCVAGFDTGMWMSYTIFDPYSQDFLLEGRNEEGEYVDIVLWDDRYFFTENVLWGSAQEEIDAVMAKKVADEADFRHVMEEASALWESILKETRQPRK